VCSQAGEEGGERLRGKRWRWRSNEGKEKRYGPGGRIKREELRGIEEGPATAL
jgi:hypothetical protein